MRSNFDPADQNNEGTEATAEASTEVKFEILYKETLALWFRYDRVLRSNFDPADQNNEGTEATAEASSEIRNETQK